MAPCADLRKLVCMLGLCALPMFARAQAGDATTSAPAGATRSTASEAASSTEAAPVVLFLLPRAPENAQAELRDALLAQFALIEARLLFTLEPEGEASLAARLQQAQTLAERNSAIAVFWIDTAADDRWFLHMMDTQDDRVVVRQVDAGGERRPAAIEAVAVMTRSSTRALIEGTPEELPPHSTEPVTAPASVAAPDQRGAFRLWLGYTGNAFAPEVPWQHGAALGASWLGLQPFFGGLSLILAPTIEPSGPSNMLPASFSVQRTPIAAQFGYRHSAGRVAFDGELGIMVERWFRPASEARDLANALATGQKGSTRWVWELAPRLRCELRIAPVLALYAGGGLDILLNKFSYVSTGERPHALLQPNPFRPVAELGVSFYP